MPCDGRLAVVGEESPDADSELCSGEGEEGPGERVRRGSECCRVKDCDLLGVWGGEGAVDIDLQVMVCGKVIVPRTWPALDVRGMPLMIEAQRLNAPRYLHLSIHHLLVSLS